MEPLHARYPFLESARTAVDRADVDLGHVVAAEDAVVERATERVELSLTDGTIGESAARSRVELLSYPVARVLVSLVDEHVCTRKYARAEAAVARERFRKDFTSTTELASVEDATLSRHDLLTEFDLTDAVTSVEDGYEVAVGAYLELAADQWGDEWRLVNRPLADGRVPIAADELDVLLKQAVKHRVADGLPFEVPDAIATELEAEEGHLRTVIADLDLTRDIDTVVPELFPPCMQALLDRVQKGEHLKHHSRFAIAAFLAGIGMTTDEIVELFQVNPGFGEDATRYQVDHIRGETSPEAYSTPSCATMQSYGDCVNPDDLCDQISHPMAYYERTLKDADDDELEDWRETAES